MKIDLLVRMVRDLDTYREEWQELVYNHPAIATRFHDLLYPLGLQRTQRYYEEMAKLCKKLNYIPRDTDADLVVAIASLLDPIDVDPRTSFTSALGRYWTNRDSYLMERAGHMRSRNHSDSMPTHPISAKALYTILCMQKKHYSPYLRAYKPESEADLLLLAERFSSPSLALGSALRAMVRRNTDKIEEFSRFMEHNVHWCNEAVFSKMPMKDRHLYAKEATLSSIELNGIPMEVYSRGHSKTYWILQSSAWSDDEKAEYLNTTMDRMEGDEILWPLATKRTTLKASARRCMLSDYYGPVLFPAPIRVNLAGRLNKKGLRRLASYLLKAPMKVKVKLNEHDKDQLWMDVHAVRQARAKNITARVTQIVKDPEKVISTIIKKHLV